jgi:hypothetical protein
MSGKVLLSSSINSKKNRNWVRDVLPYVEKDLDYFEDLGIKPTLRSIFYRLISRKILENTQSDYGYLSDFTAKCRKRSVIIRRFLKGGGHNGVLLGDSTFRILDSHQLVVQYKKRIHERHYSYNPFIIYHDEGDQFTEKVKKYVLKTDEVLPVDCFSDETRGDYIDFIDINEFKTPQEHIKKKLDFIDRLPITYNKWIPKWHNQPYHVELWTEKNAMVPTFRSILEGMDVRIVYNRGFDSVAHGWETYNRLKEAWSQGKKVKIFYCGDLDPSGDAMDEIMEESLNVFFDVKGYKEKGLYDFKRVGVLWEHIDKYELPKITDRKTLDKLKEDPRAQKFVDKYHLKSKEELFQVEIDAMAAFVPVEFKKMILDHVKIYYQELIYRRLLSDPRYSDEQISLHVMKFVQMFLDELNIKLMWKWLEEPN